MKNIERIFKFKNKEGFFSSEVLEKIAADIIKTAKKMDFTFINLQIEGKPIKISIETNYRGPIICRSINLRKGLPRVNEQAETSETITKLAERLKETAKTEEGKLLLMRQIRLVVYEDDSENIYIGCNLLADQTVKAIKTERSKKALDLLLDGIMIHDLVLNNNGQDDFNIVEINEVINIDESELRALGIDTSNH